MITSDQPKKNSSSLQCPIYTQDNEHLMKHMYVISNQIHKQEHYRNLERQETETKHRICEQGCIETNYTSK